MEAQPLSHPPRPRLVLRAGITGHRPTADRRFELDAIYASLRRVLSAADSLLHSSRSEMYCNQHEPQLALISALAAGADQMAVEAFRSMPRHEGRSSCLEVILPFSQDDYARTMGEADAAEMRRLFSLADKRLVLSDFLAGNLNEPSAIRDYRMNRRYETVGRLVVQQSDFLIAIWNGKPSEGNGGTGDIVLHALRSGLPVAWIDLSGKCKLICGKHLHGDEFDWLGRHSAHFTEQRFSDAVKPVLAPPSEKTTNIPEHSGVDKGAVDVEDGHSKRRYSLDKYFSETESKLAPNWSFYNQLLISPAKRRVADKKLDSFVTRVPRGVWTDFRSSWRMATDFVRQTVKPGWSGHHRGTCSAEQQRFADAWACADAIATGVGHRYRSTYVLVLAFSLVAVASGLVGVVFPEWKPLFVLAELTTIGAAFWLYRSSRNRGDHERWLRTREIAERMRSAWAPLMLGTAGRRFARDGEPRWSVWLSNAYLADAGLPTLEVTRDVLRGIAAAAQQGVADDQMVYHLRNSRVLDSVHQRLEKVGNLSLLIAIGSSFVLLVLLMFFHCWPDVLGTKELQERIIHALVALSAILPALGATAAALRFQGDFERFSKRSHQTMTQLKEVRDELQSFIERLTPMYSSDASSTLAFETLHEILSDMQSALLSDLDDWQFVSITKETPEPN